MVCVYNRATRRRKRHQCIYLYAFLHHAARDLAAHSLCIHRATSQLPYDPWENKGNQATELRKIQARPVNSR